MRRCCLIVSALLVPGSIMAQAPVVAPPAATLSLSEALQQAHNHNPLYQQRLNSAATARMQVRNAYGQLLPGASVSAGADYTGAGSANFGSGFVREASAVLGSNYSAGITWQIDGGRLVAPREQKANQRAIEEDIANEESGLRFSVTQQYLSVLQATAQVAVARRQVERNQNFLDLASAKYRVGQGTLIEVRQAEVQKAQSDVALLRTIQTEAEAKLELFRRIGITPPLALEEIGLSDSFPVQEPHFDLDGLLTQAKAQNPAVRALEARRHQADVGVTAAKTAFLPSLSMRAGWSAFAQQQTDGALLLSQSLDGAISSADACVAQDSIRNGAGLTPIGTPNCYASAGLDADSIAAAAALALGRGVNEARA